MDPAEAVRTCFKKYAVFSGRARRSEYWWFQLFYAVFAGLVVALVYFTQSTLPMVLFLGVILPTLAVTVRRLHDTSRSGWWLLLNFVPFGIGSLVLVVFCCMDSKAERNQWGDSPKAGAWSHTPQHQGV